MSLRHVVRVLEKRGRFLGSSSLHRIVDTVLEEYYMGIAPPRDCAYPDEERYIECLARGVRLVLGGEY